jgi:WD40 repeat protein
MRLWAVAAGACLRRFTGHKGHVFGLAISPAGRRALSAGGDGTVRLWDARTARELRCLTGHGGAVWKVAFSPTQPLALSCGSDHTLRLWRLPA